MTLQEMCDASYADFSREQLIDMVKSMDAGLARRRAIKPSKAELTLQRAAILAELDSRTDQIVNGVSSDHFNVHQYRPGIL